MDVYFMARKRLLLVAMTIEPGRQLSSIIWALDNISMLSNITDLHWSARVHCRAIAKR